MITFAVPLTGSGAVGSARVWGARGRKFESCLPDIKRMADNFQVILFVFPHLTEAVHGKCYFDRPLHPISLLAQISATWYDVFDPFRHSPLGKNVGLRRFRPFLSYHEVFRIRPPLFRHLFPTFHHMLKLFRHFLTNPAPSSAKPKSQAYPMTSQTRAFLTCHRV